VSTLPCPVAPEAPDGATAPRSRAAPPAENSASSSTASTARPRRAGPSPSAVGAAGAPSTRRLVIGVRGSPAPTPAACESWTAVSERGSQAISPYPVNSGSVWPTARQSRRTSFQEGHPAVPPHHGLGPHHLQGTPPILPEPRQHDPEDPIHLRQPRPWLTRFPHGELLPQREILRRQLAARANRGAECPKKDPEPSDHNRPNSRSLRTTQVRCDRRVFRRDNYTESLRLVF